MSGPSSQQIQLQSEQMAFYQQGIDQSQKTFAQQQELLKQMEDVYKPILAKGPNQEGFDEAEKEALNSEVTQGTATNYAKAARAAGEQIAAGAGNNPLPSGEGAQLREEVAGSAAAEESRLKEQVLQADYSQGYKEFQDAGSALSVASGQLNPVAYENAATSAGSSAETTAKDINSEENSWMAPVLGAIGSIGGAVATGGMDNLGKGKGFFG